MRWIFPLVLAGVSIAAGCTRKTTAVAESPAHAGMAAAPTSEDQAEFEAALEAFERAEREGRWTEARCNDVARRFIRVATRYSNRTGHSLPAARYNAGIAFQRCHLERRAREQFELAAKTPDFHWAHVRLALSRYEARPDLDRTIDRLERIVLDSKFQNLEALVNLAALQIARGNRVNGAPGDLEQAKKNLQRALAIDENHSAAQNQLALYYLVRAWPELSTGSSMLAIAGTRETKGNPQQLELAALVASQGILRDPDYAPLHNTAGLVHVALGRYTEAVSSFDKARRLDTGLLAAHMNYAAINLAWRGFGEAERGYRRALALAPDDYEATLGLALALRGQVQTLAPDARIEEARRLLAKARKLAPARPEADYNEARLVEHFDARAHVSSEAPLRRALGLYEKFIAKAGDRPTYRAAVARARDKVKDIRQTLRFLRN